MNGFEALGYDLQLGLGRLIQQRDHRRKVVRLTAVVAVAILALAGAATGTAFILGWPAPQHVKDELAAVDQGMPSELRLNPDVESARAVATTGESTLYQARLRDGGYCLEIVTAGDRGRGAGCTKGPKLARLPMEVMVPHDDPVTATSPVTLGGRVNATGAAKLELRYGDGSLDSVPLGEDGFFVYDVPGEHLAATHGHELTLIARDAKGAEVARQTVPDDWDAVPGSEPAAPIYVSTKSDSSDFRQVFGIEGHVSAQGAVSLELAYADGEKVAIPLDAKGDYDYTLAADRRDDFMSPQRLLAKDGQGKTVAETVVAAVAYWRRVNG